MILELPSAAPSDFPESHRWSQISSLSKVILVSGKAISCREPSLDCSGAESPGSLIFVDCSPYAFNPLRCSACCGPSRMWITLKRFSTTLEVFVPHFYLCCSHCIVPKSLMNYLNSFHRGMFKLNAKFDADLLLSSLNHFE